MTPQMRDRLQLASVAIGGLALLYMLFKGKKAAQPFIGGSVPVLIGAGGSNDAVGLSTATPSGPSSIDIPTPNLPAIPGISVPSTAPTFNIPSIIYQLMNPAGSGCCNQASSTNAYNGVPPTQLQSVPTVPATSIIQDGYAPIYSGNISGLGGPSSVLDEITSVFN